MKTLQNNFTTPEQSKRLLELGVPADSANCYIEMYSSGYTNTRILQEGDSFSKMESFCAKCKREIIPCWSAGRLIEIYLTCAKEYHSYDDFYTETPSIHFDVYSKEMLVEEIINSIEVDNMDFSKLEN